MIHSFNTRSAIRAATVLRCPTSPARFAMRNPSAATGMTTAMNASAASTSASVKAARARLEPVLKTGGADDPPAPVGDPTTGTAAGNVVKRPCPLARTVAPVPSGESPDGTGGSPVLPANHFSNTLLGDFLQLASAQDAIALSAPFDGVAEERQRPDPHGQQIFDWHQPEESPVRMGTGQFRFLII